MGTIFNSMVLTVTPETCPCFCHRRFSHATVWWMVGLCNTTTNCVFSNESHPVMATQSVILGASNCTRLVFENPNVHNISVSGTTLDQVLTQRYDGWSVCEQYLHSVLLLSANIRTSNLPNLLIIGIRGAQFVSCIYRVPVSIFVPLIIPLRREPCTTSPNCCINAHITWLHDLYGVYMHDIHEGREADMDRNNKSPEIGAHLRIVA
jgi:hypothetical protein